MSPIYREQPVTDRLRLRPPKTQHISRGALVALEVDMRSADEPNVPLWREDVEQLIEWLQEALR